MTDAAVSAHAKSEPDLPSVEAELSYLTPPKGKPYTYAYPAPEGVPATNAEYEPRRERVFDLRPIASGLSLDRQGFELVRSPTAVTDFYDEAQLDVTAHTEAAEIVKAATGAARVLVFDHTLRRRSDDQTAGVPGQVRPAVMRIHNDYTETSGPRRVRDFMGAEAEALLGRRYAFVNVWRPIKGPVVDTPLAVCDVTTTAPDDFVSQDLIYPDRVGEIQTVTWRSSHRWFYAPRMTTDEVLLIKCFDSRTDVARFTPHTAFVHPDTPADAEPRESIEIRTVAFF